MTSARLSGRLLGYKRVVRIFDGATLMWRNMGSPSGGGRLVGLVQLVRNSPYGQP